MNKILFLLLALLFITPSFAQTQKKGFKISGTTTGFADSTKLFLYKYLTSGGELVDSALIINNQFQFSGFVKEGVVQHLIRTKDLSNYKFLWLENSMITFTAEKGKFRDAVIAGSATQDDANKLSDAIKAGGNEKEQDIFFIRNHPNSIISVYTLSVYSSSWRKDTVAMLYNSLSPAIKNTSYGKNVSEYLALNKDLTIGSKYADFTQADTKGKNVKLSDFNGKLVLLEFWGSWCGPCREGNPELVKIYTEYKNKGFDILGVAADESKEEWISAVKKDGLPWQNVCDLKGDKNKAVLIYGVSYFPANFLIDKNGVIIAKDLRGEDLRNRLKEILK